MATGVRFRPPNFGPQLRRPPWACSTTRSATGTEVHAAAEARAGDGARDSGKALAGLGVGMRVTRSRELVAEGCRPAAVARVAQTSRQAIYRTPKPRRAPASPGRPPACEVEQAIV